MAPGRRSVAVNNSQQSQLSDVPLVPYELQRLMRCMQNNARLNELGIYDAYKELLEMNKNSHKKKSNPSSTNSKDSESEYEPSEDDTNDDNAKGSNECNMGTANKTTGVIQLRSKRVYAQQEVTRNTRSKKATVQSAATLAPSLNIDDHTQPTIEADGPTQLDESTYVADEGHAVTSLGCQNNTCSEDNGHAQANANMTNGDEVNDDSNLVPNEDVELGEIDHWERGTNMGRGLYRMNRALLLMLH